MDTIPERRREHSSTCSRVPEEGARFPINSQSNLCVWRLTQEDLGVWSGNASAITATTKPKTNIFTMASTWHPILNINHPSPATMGLSLPMPGPLQGSILSYPQSNVAGPIQSTSSAQPTQHTLLSLPASQAAPSLRPWEGMTSE